MEGPAKIKKTQYLYLGNYYDSLYDIIDIITNNKPKTFINDSEDSSISTFPLGFDINKDSKRNIFDLVLVKNERLKKYKKEFYKISAVFYATNIYDEKIIEEIFYFNEMESKKNL